MLRSFLQSFWCNGMRERSSDDTSSMCGGFNDEGLSRQKKYLVLDLDETLVHSKYTAYESSTHTVRMTMKNSKSQIHLMARPHLLEFMEEMSKYYEIAIFTASPREYADPVISTIEIDRYIKHRFYRKDCTTSWYGMAKNLSILGVPLKDVVLIDDTLGNSRFQPDNILLVDEFRGEKNDDALLKLIPFLKDLASHRDVRNVDAKHLQYRKELKEKGIRNLKLKLEKAKEIRQEIVKKESVLKLKQGEHQESALYARSSICNTPSTAESTQTEPRIFDSPLILETKDLPESVRMSVIA